MRIDAVPGMLVVVVRKSKRAFALYKKFKSNPLVRCSCSAVRKGIYVVDDVFEDVAILQLKNGARVLVAPLDDIEPAVEI